MARRSISIDEKIERQKDVVSVAKDKYDAALAELRHALSDMSNAEFEITTTSRHCEDL